MKPLELGAELLAPDNDTADGLGDSYVQRFGEHAEWNDLYKDAGWLPTMVVSVECKRSHFNGIFRTIHHLRTMLPPEIDPTDATTAVFQSIAHMIHSRTWLRFAWSLKTHLRAKHRLLDFRDCRRAERERLLNDMVQYWRYSEDQKRHDLRKVMQTTSGLEQLRKVSAEIITMQTPEEIKADVLWQLYWLLRIQHNYRTYGLCLDLLELISTRRQVSAAKRSAAVSHESTKVALLGLDVEIACLGLRLRPLQLTPKAVPFRELLKVAIPDSRIDPSPTTGTPLVLRSFLHSLLCTDRDFMGPRCGQPGALYPPRGWRPPPPALRALDMEILPFAPSLRSRSPHGCLPPPRTTLLPIPQRPRSLWDPASGLPDWLHSSAELSLDFPLLPSIPALTGSPRKPHSSPTRYRATARAKANSPSLSPNQHAPRSQRSSQGPSPTAPPRVLGPSLSHEPLPLPRSPSVALTPLAVSPLERLGSGSGLLPRQLSSSVQSLAHSLAPSLGPPALLESLHL